MNFKFRGPPFLVEMIDGNLTVYLSVEGLRICPRSFAADTPIYRATVKIAKKHGLIED